MCVCVCPSKLHIVYEVFSIQKKDFAISNELMRSGRRHKMKY